MRNIFVNKKCEEMYIDDRRTAGAEVLFWNESKDAIA